PATLASLAADVRSEADRMVKRPVATETRSLPAGIVLLGDRLSLLIVIDEATTVAGEAPGAEAPAQADDTPEMSQPAMVEPAAVEPRDGDTAADATKAGTEETGAFEAIEPGD